MIEWYENFDPNLVASEQLAGRLANAKFQYLQTKAAGKIKPSSELN